MRKTEDHIALFIDCDNISHKAIEGIINELSKYGVVNIRQAYGNWTKDNLKNWNNIMPDVILNRLKVILEIYWKKQKKRSKRSM